MFQNIILPQMHLPQENKITLECLINIRIANLSTEANYDMKQIKLKQSNAIEAHAILMYVHAHMFFFCTALS